MADIFKKIKDGLWEYGRYSRRQEHRQHEIDMAILRKKYPRSVVATYKHTENKYAELYSIRIRFLSEADEVEFIMKEINK